MMNSIPVLHVEGRCLAEAYEKAAQLRDDIRHLREAQHKLKDPA